MPAPRWVGLNVRLRGHKGVQEVELRQLGKINVVCGRNNSGKSTILEALANADKHSYGHPNAQVVRIFETGMLQAFGWRPEDGGRAEFVKSIVAEAVATRPAWYKPDAAALIAAFEEKQKASPIAGTGWRGEPFRNSLPELLVVQSPKTVLIPAKRRLDSEDEINSSAGGVPEGSGVLNVLLRGSLDLGGTRNSIYKGVFESFKTITDGWRFAITLEEKNRLHLNFVLPDGTHRSADDCGLGMRDLLILLYFAFDPSWEMILIEEPESHLHPEYQRKLLATLRESDKLYILATHANVFLDNAYIDRVYFAQAGHSIAVEDATSRASILDDLGYSVVDNLVSDLIILIEGPRDVEALEELLKKTGVLGNYVVKFWPLGGNNMEHVDLGVFAERYRMMALVDQDPGSESSRVKFVSACQEYNIPCTRLGRYSIENYYTPRALRAILGDGVPEALVISPGRPLTEQLPLYRKRRGRDVARAMELDEVRGTDLGDFLESVVAALRT